MLEGYVHTLGCAMIVMRFLRCPQAVGKWNDVAARVPETAVHIRRCRNVTFRDDITIAQCFYSRKVNEGIVNAQDTHGDQLQRRAHRAAIGVD